MAEQGPGGWSVWVGLQVGAADAARTDAEDELAASGIGSADVDDLETVVVVEDGDPHLRALPSSRSSSGANMIMSSGFAGGSCMPEGGAAQGHAGEDDAEAEPASASYHARSSSAVARQPLVGGRRLRAVEHRRHRRQPVLLGHPAQKLWKNVVQATSTSGGPTPAISQSSTAPGSKSR